MATTFLDLPGLQYFKGKLDAIYAASLSASGLTFTLKSKSGATLATATGSVPNATTTAAGLMSSTDKAKLDGVAAGAQVNVLEAVKVNGTALTITSKAVNIDLTPYALKTEVSTAVLYKGSVDTYAELPASPNVGDLYNVVAADTTHGVQANGNVVWNGTEWDVLGPMFEYDAITNAQIDTLF